MDIKNNIRKYQLEAQNRGANMIAVSKTQPVDKIREAYDAGQLMFGENKVQEMTAKAEVLPPDIAWHLIGHLQSNKVKYIAPFVSLIHSVDSLKLVDELDKQGRKINRVIPCLLQVFIAREETKFGLDENELLALLENPVLTQRSFVRVCGLMGMASLTDDRGQIRQEFHGLKLLFEKIKLRKSSLHVAMEELSMGMSSDYDIALEEGSTLVRIGTAIFGERKNL